MRSIFFGLFFLCFINASAQDKYDADSIYNVTQGFIDSKNWNGLIKYGETALNNRVESFVLRTRLGMAYFAVKNYFKAIPNFEKARSLSRDPEIAEYLYYSYLFTGREEDKNFIFYELPKGLRRRLKPLENSFVDNIHAEYGKGFSNDFKKNEDLDLQAEGGVYGEQTLNGDHDFFNAGLKQIPLRFITVSYDYTYRKISKEKKIQFDDTYNITDKYFQYHNQFYNRFDFRVLNGLSVSPAAHYISIKDSTYYPDDTDLSLYPLRSESFTENFVLSLAASKYLSIFNFGINGSFSYLNKEHQSQYGLLVKCFPFSKVNFYSLTKLVLHNQQNVQNLITSQSFGGRIGKFIYEANVTFGNQYNFNEANGFIVYDDPDVIKYRIGADLKYNISYNFSAHLSYNFQHRERQYFTYSFSIENPGAIIQKANYDMNTLVIGMNYIF
ncbi:MAG: hypothetical protein ABI462_08645 [Ignavibacteria bacterium]